MPTFPCSIRDAAEALGVYRSILGVLIREYGIPTTPCPRNPAAKLLDEASYRRLAIYAEKYRPVTAIGGTDR